MTHPLLQSKGHKPRRGLVKLCEQCGGEFYVMRCQAETKIFCSMACHAAAQRTNRPLNCEVCGAEFYVSRSQQAQRNRKTCSRACQRVWQSRNVRGERAGQWKGGVTPANVLIRTSCEMRAWRKAVFTRDNYTCQRCGARSAPGKPVALRAHHIKLFSTHIELRFEVSNGLTLCYPCHRAVHREMKEVAQ
jgi:ribosomal protein L33